MILHQYEFMYAPNEFTCVYTGFSIYASLHISLLTYVMYTVYECASG